MNLADNRQKMLIHVAKANLAISDTVYRNMLSAYGVASSRELTVIQADRLLQHFRTLGWKPRRRKDVSVTVGRVRDTYGGQARTRSTNTVHMHEPRKYSNYDNRTGMASGGQLRKIEALWMQVCRYGCNDQGLRKFLLRRFRVSDMRFLTDKTASKVITALNDIRAHGWSGRQSAKR